MDRRVEDKLRALCTQLLAVNNDKELHPIVVELRNGLHQHYLGKMLCPYPFLVERRKRSGIPPLQEQEAS
jgi:hypothetical protein